VPEARVDADVDRLARIRERPDPAADVDRVVAEILPAFGNEDRLTLAGRLAVGTDARAERYWQLLAIINGWPPVPATVPAWEWLIAALRA
jgi:hypothetical protein